MASRLGERDEAAVAARTPYPRPPALAWFAGRGGARPHGCGTRGSPGGGGRLPTSPDQMVVTCGALAAIAMTARALTTTGDRVLMESPTYPNALATWRRSGARLTGVGGDPQGWDLDSVVAALHQV